MHIVDPGGGGGGALSIYTDGGVPWNLKKGGLRHGHNPKKGVLGTGTSRERGGGLRQEHESKRGCLKNWSCKKDHLRN